MGARFELGPESPLRLRMQLVFVECWLLESVQPHRNVMVTLQGKRVLAVARFRAHLVICHATGGRPDTATSPTDTHPRKIHTVHAWRILQQGGPYTYLLLTEAAVPKGSIPATSPS